MNAGWATWTKPRPNHRRLTAGQSVCVEPNDTEDLSGISCALALAAEGASIIVCVVAGLGWALAAVIGGAEFDGYPPEYYDAGNRAAFGMALVLLTMACPGGCLAGYTFGRLVSWSRIRSLAIAQVGGAAPAIAVFSMLV